MHPYAIDLTSSFHISPDRLEILKDQSMLDRHWDKIDKRGNKITLHQTLVKAPHDKIFEILRIRPSAQPNGPVTQLYLREYVDDMGIQEGISCMYARGSKYPGDNKGRAILDGCAENSFDLIPANPYGFRKIFVRGREVRHENGVDYAFANCGRDILQQAQEQLRVQQELKDMEDRKKRQIFHIFLNTKPVRQIGNFINSIALP